jgi:hypothetical protein
VQALTVGLKEAEREKEEEGVAEELRLGVALVDRDTVPHTELEVERE